MEEKKKKAFNNIKKVYKSDSEDNPKIKGKKLRKF